MKEETSSTSPEILVEAFHEALDHATRQRMALRDLAGDPIAWMVAAQDALAPYDKVFESYVFAQQGGWSEADAAGVDGGYHRVTALLGDLLEEVRVAPQVLTGQTVLVDQEDVFLIGEDVFRQNREKDERRRKQEAGCCFSRIRFKSIGANKIRLRARNDEGGDVTRTLRPGQERPLTSQDTMGVLVPGGLGRCVTLDVTVQRNDGTWDTPPYTARLCCDDPAVAVGARPQFTRPSPPGSTIPQLFPLEITQLVKMEPCEEGETQEGASPHGRPHGRIRSIGGAQVGPRSYHYGADCRLRFVPNPGTCQHIGFVQAVKRTVELKRPGQDDWQRSGGLSSGDRYHLDVPRDQTTPGYPHTTDLPGGGKEMRDFPGVENPWGAFDLDGQHIRRLPRGTQLRATWEFITWVVCLDRGVQILGHFTWKSVLTLTIGRDQRDTQGEIEMTVPQWSNDPKADDYRRIVREARNPAGWL